MFKQKIFLLSTLLLTSSAVIAADDGKFPQDDERWGYFSLRSCFLEHGKLRGDVVVKYQALTPEQQAAVTKALREKQDRSGKPVDTKVGKIYDSLLEKIVDSLPAKDASSAGADLAHALVPADMPVSAPPVSFWNYQKIRSQFFKDLGQEAGQSYRKKAVRHDAELIYNSLNSPSQGLLMAYLALKLEGRVGKKSLEPGLKPLFQELFARCEKCPRAADAEMPKTPLDPKRPGTDYTARELSQAGCLLQGVSAFDFLSTLASHFTEMRAMKLLEDIINAEDNSVADATVSVSPPVKGGTLKEITVNDDGSVAIEFVEGGIANVEPFSVLSPLSKEDLKRALAFRESVKVLKGAVIPASTKVAPSVPTASDALSGDIHVVDGLVQDIMMHADFKDGLVGVHSFGNARKLGGGVWNGRPPQEEDLMRALPEVAVSYMCVPGRRGLDIFLKSGEVMVTPGTGDHSHLRVLAAALPSVHAVAPSGAATLHHDDVPVYGKKVLSQVEYETVIETDILNLLSVAHTQKVHYLITGAWGSGAYKNDPNLIANKFKKVLNADDGTGKPWCQNFEAILFVIPKLNDDGSESANFAAYKKAFAE